MDIVITPWIPGRSWQRGNEDFSAHHKSQDWTSCIYYSGAVLFAKKKLASLYMMSVCMDSDQDWGPKWSTHFHANTFFCSNLQIWSFWIHGPYTPEIYCRTMMACGFNSPEQICSSFRVHSPELFRIWLNMIETCWTSQQHILKPTNISCQP